MSVSGRSVLYHPGPSQSGFDLHVCGKLSISMHVCLICLKYKWDEHIVS